MSYRDLLYRKQSFKYNPDNGGKKTPLWDELRECGDQIYISQQTGREKEIYTDLLMKIKNNIRIARPLLNSLKLL